MACGCRRCPSSRRPVVDRAAKPPMPRSELSDIMRPLSSPAALLAEPGALDLRHVSLRCLLDHGLGVWPEPKAFLDQTIALLGNPVHILAMVSIEGIKRRLAERRVVAVQDAEARERGCVRNGISGCVGGGRDVDERRPEPAQGIAEAVAGDRACAS